MSEKPQAISSLGNPQVTDTLQEIRICLSEKEMALIYMENNIAIGFELFSNNADSISKIAADFKPIQQKIKIYIDRPEMSLFPTKDLNSLKKDIVGKQLFGNDKHDFLIDFVDANKSLLFALPTEEHSLLKSHLPLAKIKHFSTAMMLNVSKKVSAENEEVFLDVRNGYFFLFLYQQKNLRLANSYRYQNKNEFGFFSLGAMKNMGFDMAKLRLHLSGAVEENSPLTALLHTYVKDVKIQNYDGQQQAYRAYHQLINGN
jgi:hypothetical protein